MKKIVSLLLCVVLLLGLTACGNVNNESSVPQTNEELVETNVYVLSGPTGIGAANLKDKAEKGETQNTREKLGVDCTSRMCFNRDNLARIAKRKIFDPDFKNSDIDKCVQTIKREVLDFTYYLDKANMNSVFADMYSILVTFDKDFNLDKCWLINTTTRFPELPIYPKDDILCETLGIRSYLDLPELKKILKDFLEKGILPNV